MGSNIPLAELQGEIERLQREVAKLQAEGSTHKGRWQRFASWIARFAGNITVLLSVISASAAFILGLGQFADDIKRFLTQQEEEIIFRVNKELITLVGQLGSKDEVKRANAAIVLAAFEETAVPILLNSLRVETSKKSIEAHAKSLALISTTVDAKRVALPLRKQAEALFQKTIEGEKATIVALENYLFALAALQKIDDKEATAEMLRNFSAGLKQAESLDDEEREGIYTYIRNACNKLGVTGC